MMEVVLSFLRRQVGLRTDSANASGSLHAKVENINDNTIPNQVATRQGPRGPVSEKGSFSSLNGDVWETALDITGRGCLIGLGAYASTTTSGTTVTVKVTVDGYTFQFNTPTATSGYFYPAPAWIYTSVSALDTVANGGRSDMFSIGFKSSLKIEIHYNNAAEHAVYWAYVKE